MESTYIELRHVEKAYRTGTIPTPVLRDLSLSLRKGSFTAVIGPSGCGKSTLLALLGALDKPDAGDVLVDGFDLGRAEGADLSAYRREKVGFVFQSYNLLRSLSAVENVEAALQFSDLSGEARRARARECLDAVGVPDLGKKLPHQLSGGQQQRVAIARAIARRPALLLADEPTGNLDREAGARVFACLTELQRATGVTCVMVTHDPDLAAQTDVVVRMLVGRIAPAGEG